MSGDTTTEPEGTTKDQFFALMIVVCCAAVGGLLIALLKGFKIGANKCYKEGCRLPSLSDTITIPPLVGMIVCGCLVRNFYGSYMDNLNEDWAEWVRMICLSIILLRGGLELDFEGKGLTVVLLTLCPQLVEASASAIAAKLIFGFTWTICVAMGFVLAAVSPAVVVPSCMKLQDQGFGTKKGIPTSLIAAASFDDIFAITFFGIAKTLAFNEAGTQDESALSAVFLNVI